MESFKNFVHKYFEENREVILKEIGELVSIPSVNDGSFGEPVKEVLKKGAALAGKYGYEVEIKDKYVLARYGKGAKTVGVFAHLDVVPVENQDWQVTEPFKMIEKDGFLFGRGVDDNKQAAVFACHYPKIIKQSGIPFDAEIVLYLGSNEENGMKDIDEFAQNEKMPDISVVPDNSFPVCIGEKTIIGITLTAKTAFESPLEICGGSATNIVLGKATAKLDKNGQCEEIEAEGISAHAAYPEGSQNAGALLYDILCKREDIPESDKATLTAAKDISNSYYGQLFGIDGEQEGFGKNTCVNGVVKTEDGKLSLTLDIRCGSDTDSDEVLAKVKAKAEELGFDTLITRNKPGFEIKEIPPQAEAMLKVYRDYTGDDKAFYYFSRGGTYARKLKNAFSVGTSVPLGEKTGLPEGHGGAHQPDECISVKGMFMGAEIVMNMVIEASK